MAAEKRREWNIKRRNGASSSLSSHTIRFLSGNLMRSVWVKCDSKCCFSPSIPKKIRNRFLLLISSDFFSFHSQNFDAFLWQVQTIYTLNWINIDTNKKSNLWHTHIVPSLLFFLFRSKNTFTTTTHIFFSSALFSVVLKWHFFCWCLFFRESYVFIWLLSQWIAADISDYFISLQFQATIASNS